MFSLNSLFSRKMTKLFDLCLLNVLCIITSLPVITMGASFTALYTVLMAMSKDEEGPVTRMYINVFKSNFKKSSLAGVILLLIVAVLIVDLEIWNASGSEQKPMFVTATFVLLAFVAMAAGWLFPLLAKFENSLKNMYKNAFLFAMKYFPVSLSMGVVTIGYTMLLMEYFFTLWMPALFIGIIILAYPWSFYVRSRFEKYLEDLETAPSAGAASEKEFPADGKIAAQEENTCV